MTSGRYSDAARAWSLAPISHVRSASSTIPLGRFALVAAIAVRTDSSGMPARFSSAMFISTRTAGSALPLTSTCPTPLTWAIRCASTVDATSYIWPRVKAPDVSVRIMTGASDGLAL